MVRSLCVYCRRRGVDDRHRPFCSERCKTADLGRWLTGDYKVASAATLDPDSEVSLEMPEEDDQNEPQTPH